MAHLRTLGRQLAGPRPRWSTAVAVLGIVALAEFAAMFLLACFPKLPPWQEAALDAALLTLLASPLLWWLTRDLARRIEAADRQQQAARLGAIFDATVDGIVVTDADGRILAFNPGAEKIFGYTAAEVLGQPLRILLPPRVAERHDDYLRSFRDGAASARLMGQRGGLAGWTKDGREIPVDVSIARAGAEGEVTLVAVVRDVTVQRRFEAELAAAKEQAEAATRAKSVFLATMSHEIRTPMNAVVGLADLMLDTPLNAEQREFAETIRGSGDALLAVINDILDLSKIEAGHLALEQAPFALRPCVETVADLLGTRAAQKRLDLVTEVDETVPDDLAGDVTRLRQVLLNLAGNAIKFTDTGEVIVHARAVAFTAARVELQFDIRDTGVGLTAEQQARLFQPFTQADNSITRRYGGTGLGLAISRSLVEMMGGRIWVTSRPGAGATFSFTASFAIPAPSRRDPGPAPLTLAGRRLLVVDDNATNRRILLHQIERWGALAVPCASPRAALATLAQGEPCDLALLDLHMPEMDGVELAQKIRALPGTPPPLLLLSSAGTALPPEARALFAGVLHKPVKRTILRAAVANTLDTGAAGTARTPASGVDRELAHRLPLRVLLADDNPVNRLVTTSMLERFGYHPTAVADGDEALEVALRMNFDLVLMDMQMPRLDGLETTRRLRRHESLGGARAFIVAMTANVSCEDRLACEQAGMDDFLPKPARLAELRTVIERAAVAYRGAVASRGSERLADNRPDVTTVVPQPFGSTQRHATGS
ncbi:MAG: response regulator [Verrucomicrobia bacterium]|nr:response regulator [Verrucomicrobiota bacterium]